jgi:hypothetical protein
MTSGLANPLPAANSRQPFRFRRLGEFRCSMASSELGSPAAVAEGGRWVLMRSSILHSLAVAAFMIAFAPAAFADDSLPPIFFTNQTAIANARTVLAAVRSGDLQSRTNVQALIGSQVVFAGGAAPPGGNADLLVSSNLVLKVQISPARDVRPHSVFWVAEVLGTLKSVDFEKRTIHIVAKPKDWRPRELR